MKVNVAVKNLKSKNKNTSADICTEAFIDTENRIATLKDGTIYNLNMRFLALNDGTCNKLERCVWLLRADGYTWHEVSLIDTPHSNFLARREGDNWVSSRKGQIVPKEKVSIITPSRKLIKCKQLVVTPNGFRETIQFVWEAKNNFIRKNFDGTEYRYPKNNSQGIPLGTIYRNNECVSRIYMI